MTKRKSFRPIQQIYRTMCNGQVCLIRQLSPHYQTTNMTYGSFHYNNWSFIQKQRRARLRKSIHSGS